jgi:hypothetical protein
MTTDHAFWQKVFTDYSNAPDEIFICTSSREFQRAWRQSEFREECLKVLRELYPDATFIRESATQEQPLTFPLLAGMKINIDVRLRFLQEMIKRTSP